MQHFALVEDEDTAVSSFERCAKRYEEEKGEGIRITHFPSCELFLDRYTPIYDAVFFDIQLRGINGMEGAMELRKKDDLVRIVFLTNLSSFAVNGYSVGATDFLIKPLTFPTFSLTVDKLRRLNNHKDEDVVLKTADSTVRLSIKEIARVEVSGHQVVYYTEKGTFSLWESLRAQTERLSGKGFGLVSKYCLVNLSHVERIEGNDIVVGGEKVSLSRSYRKAFLDAMLTYYGRRV